MSKQRISNSPETLDYLLNEKIPISDRLAKHNKYDCLAFITSPGMLYPHFCDLVCGNEDYIKAFWIEKQKAIDTIQEKQRTLEYEAFVKYLFNETGIFDNRRTLPGKKENNWQENVIYDITPTSAQQANILERISIEHAKANEGGFFKKPSRLGNKNLLVPFISFNSLKTALQESLGKPYADKQQVIAEYRKQYLEPLQDTETESTAQTIYRNFKTGKTDNYKGKDYFFYATKGAVLELLDFEKYIGQSDVWEKEIEDYQITKQSNHIFKHTKDYVFSEAEKRRVERQMKKEDAEKYYKNRLPDANGNYKITFKPEIDSKLNSALNRDYSVFNEGNKNYRVERFNNIGQIEIFKIHNKEYLIEGDVNEKGNYTIHIYNYGYSEKWLRFLDGLIANFCWGQLSGIKEDIIEDAKTKRLNDIEGFADAIESIFFHCIDYNNNKNFEGLNHTTERHTLFRYINMPGGIFWWKQEKEKELNNSMGSLLQKLEDLFISADPNTFMQTRDFIILWIEKVINITINNDTKMFQWGYSPFMEDIFNLGKKIKELFSDERISLKNNLLTANHNPTQQSNEAKPDEVEAKHSHIFKNNAFRVFEKYHSNKNLTEQCRTDLRAVFELMKNDCLLVETVELKHYINWLNQTYTYSLTELKKVDLNTRPNQQRKNDYNAIKTATLN